MVDMLFAMATDQLLLLGYVIIAMVLGGIIGYEREQADKPAGLRTHMFVAGTATLLVGLSDTVVHSSDLTPSMIRSDPIRIIEAIITGISFLGAGTILRRKDKGDVEGLTTAASLLFVAGVGVAVGIEQFILAVGMTIIGFIVLYVVKSIGLPAQTKN